MAGVNDRVGAGVDEQADSALATATPTAARTMERRIDTKEGYRSILGI